MITSASLTPRSCRRKAPPARFLLRGAAYFAAHGIGPIQRVMTDNSWAYRFSLGEAVRVLGAKQVFIRPHFRWQRQGRTPQPHAAK
jgi:hypothetical protein